MARSLLLIAVACLLTACGIGSGTVAQDIALKYPGCQLEELASTRSLGSSDDFVLAKFTYTCAGERHRRYGNFVYEKAMNTGFTSYCCAREARPEEL